MAVVMLACTLTGFEVGPGGFLYSSGYYYTVDENDVPGPRVAMTGTTRITLGDGYTNPLWTDFANDCRNDRGQFDIPILLAYSPMML